MLSIPRILELFSELNRDWLYFGEGPMLKTDAGEILTSDAPAETATASHCQRRIAKLEAELKEECA